MDVKRDGNCRPTTYQSQAMMKRNQNGSGDGVRVSGGGSKVKLCGYLKKKRNKVGGWRKMYFVLQDKLLLSYASREEYDNKLVSFIDVINLVPGTIILPLGGNRFTVETTSQLFTFHCDDRMECRDWITVLLDSLAIQSSAAMHRRFSQQFCNISADNIPMAVTQHLNDCNCQRARGDGVCGGSGGGSGGFRGLVTVKGMTNSFESLSHVERIAAVAAIPSAAVVMATISSKGSSGDGGGVVGVGGVGCVRLPIAHTTATTKHIPKLLERNGGGGGVGGVGAVAGAGVSSSSKPLNMILESSASPSTSPSTSPSPSLPSMQMQIHQRKEMNGANQRLTEECQRCNSKHFHLHHNSLSFSSSSTSTSTSSFSSSSSSHKMQQQPIQLHSNSMINQIFHLNNSKKIVTHNDNGKHLEDISSPGSSSLSSSSASRHNDENDAIDSNDHHSQHQQPQPQPPPHNDWRVLPFPLAKKRTTRTIVNELQRLGNSAKTNFHKYIRDDDHDDRQHRYHQQQQQQQHCGNNSFHNCSKYETAMPSTTTTTTATTEIQAVTNDCAATGKGDLAATNSTSNAMLPTTTEAEETFPADGSISCTEDCKSYVMVKDHIEHLSIKGTKESTTCDHRVESERTIAIDAITKHPSSAPSPVTERQCGSNSRMTTVSTIIEEQRIMAGGKESTMANRQQQTHPQSQSQLEPIYAVVDLKNKYAHRNRRLSNFMSELKRCNSYDSIVHTPIDEAELKIGKLLKNNEKSASYTTVDIDGIYEDGDAIFLKDNNNHYGHASAEGGDFDKQENDDEEEEENIYEPINVTSSERPSPNSSAFWKYITRLKVTPLLHLTRIRNRITIEYDKMKLPTSASPRASTSTSATATAATSSAINRPRTPAPHSHFNSIRHKFGAHRKSMQLRMRKFYTRTMYEPKPFFKHHHTQHHYQQQQQPPQANGGGSIALAGGVASSTGGGKKKLHHRWRTMKLRQRHMQNGACPMGAGLLKAKGSGPVAAAAEVNGVGVVDNGDKMPKRMQKRFFDSLPHLRKTRTSLFSSKHAFADSTQRGANRIDVATPLTIGDTAIDRSSADTAGSRTPIPTTIL